MENDWNTLEIYLAAFLSIRGFKPIVLPPNEEGKVYFSFDCTAHGFFKTLNEYNSRDAIIPLVDFVREIKYLRGLMHQQKFGGKDGKRQN